ETEAASSVGAVYAKLNGLVTANDTSAAAYFEWGTTAAYGTTSPLATVGPGSTRLAYDLNGLQPNTTYHFRLVASNSNGTDRGGDRTFTTSENTVGPRIETLTAKNVTA